MVALTRRCPASLAGRRALAPRIWGGRAHALIGFPGLHPTSPRTPGRGPARPFHGTLRETRNGHTPVTSQYVCNAVSLYTILDKSLSVRSKFHWHEGVFCFTLKVYLHNSSQHRCLLAASDRAPKLAPHYRGEAAIPRRRRRRTSRRPDRTHSHTAHRRGTRPHEHPQ